MGNQDVFNWCQAYPRTGLTRDISVGVSNYQSTFRMLSAVHLSSLRGLAQYKDNRSSTWSNGADHRAKSQRLISKDTGKVI